MLNPPQPHQTATTSVTSNGTYRERVANLSDRQMSQVLHSAIATTESVRQISWQEALAEQPALATHLSSVHASVQLHPRVLTSEMLRKELHKVTVYASC